MALSYKIGLDVRPSVDINFRDQLADMRFNASKVKSPSKLRTLGLQPLSTFVPLDVINALFDDYKSY